ncbi:MAG TPA: FRG domain-containing protein [Nitrospira sp.]|nr:FRG domain-containing protein [Nitrospira sp.]
MPMPLPGKVIRITSWRELVEELHSRQLVQLQHHEGNHMRSPYVFRGIDNAQWGLQTSLQRLCGFDESTHDNDTDKIDIIERSLIRSFRKYATAGAFDKSSEWYVLAVGQHNGLPTRCLDWTSSPFVAAHFACGKEGDKDKDGSIWCLHTGILRDVNERSLDKASRSLKRISWVYDTRLLEESFADLEEFGARSIDTNNQLLLIWEPPSLDQRIANQAGLLSIMNNAIASQTQFFQRHAKHFTDLLVRIEIDKRAKSEIRDMLDQNNISERMLYPGLPGLCDWLKRYYGKAWS